MPIEFYCPGCGTLMRTPDQTAGRKGKCPHCGTKVQIPGASMAADAPAGKGSQPPQGGRAGPAAPRPQPASQPAAGARPAAGAPSSAPANPAAQGAIRFSCSGCRKLLSVPAANAGKRGKCPHCGKLMQIPASSTAAPAAQKSPASKWKGTPNAAAAGTIRFACPRCAKQVRVAASAAGQHGQCPHCKTVVTIPAAQPPAAAPGGGAGLAPLSAGGGLAPLGVPEGLTPLGDTGLTPLDGGGLDPLGGGLDPLGGLDSLGGGLDPLGGGLAGDPFAAGAAPLNDPLGGWPAGGGAAAANPYAGPAAAGATARAKPRRKSSGSRKGLPWERPNDDKQFFGTINMVLFSPNEAFDSMKRSGGIGRPLLFSVMGASFSLGIIVGLVMFIVAILVIIGMAMGGGLPGGEGDGELQLTAGVMLVLGFLYLLCYIAAYVLLYGVIIPLLRAAIFHLVIMLVDDGNQGFETTFRVVAYVSGTTMALLPLTLIPIVGSLVALMFPVVDIVLNIVGLRNAHETTGAKASLAVLLPMAVALSICCGIVFTFWASIVGLFSWGGS